jgi:hypothetical protein
MENGLRKINYFPFSIWCLHVSISMSPCPCPHASMSQCVHVSMPPCLHLSISPSFYVFMSMSTSFYVSMSSSPCLYVLMSLSLYVSGVPQTKNATNGKLQLRLFSSNREQKRQTSICLLQTETENGSLFSLVGNLKSTIAVSANVQTCLLCC